MHEKIEELNKAIWYISGVIKCIGGDSKDTDSHDNCKEELYKARTALDIVEHTIDEVPL